MPEQHFDSMVAELRRRLEIGGRFHAPTVFDVTSKQWDQLIAELTAKPFREAVIGENSLELWGVPVRVV